MSRYIDQKFTEQFKATIGADLMPKEVVIDDRTIKLQVYSIIRLFIDLGHSWSRALSKFGIIFL